jgi:hypothetical protein
MLLNRESAGLLTSAILYGATKLRQVAVTPPMVTGRPELRPESFVPLPVWIL